MPDEKLEKTFHERVLEAISGPKASAVLIELLEKIGFFQNKNESPKEQ